MKKIIFSLILLFSFESSANIQSYWSFSDAWISKLQKECEPIFLEEYTKFPEKYYQLNGKDKVFFCALMLERVGVDMSESNDWFKQAKMQNIWEKDYEANIGQLPAEYYLIPRRGEAREIWIIERLKEHKDNKKMQEKENEKDAVRNVGNLLSFVYAPFGWVVNIIATIS